ncbi:YdcF family protein [Clostridiaceae bacterium M8S5]|nr:YdcF family protein [Clostridiaceae bacterium M8S5]
MIPKYPELVELTDKQIQEITDIVFGEDKDVGNHDVIFVFGSTHPLCYETTLKAYNNGLGNDIVISGGNSKSRDKHKDWKYGSKSEADAISSRLIDKGVPIDKLYIEEKATNSKENVIFTKEIYDFTSVKSILIISKNYVAGRQMRTLKKYMPDNIKEINQYSYNVYIEDGVTFGRYDWMKYDKSKSLILGEYLRIYHYGNRGDIEKLKKPVEGLSEYVNSYNLD